MSNFNDLYDHVAADRSRAMQLLGIQDIRRKAISELLAAGAYTEPDNIEDMTDAEREQHKAEAAYALGRPHILEAAKMPAQDGDETYAIAVTATSETPNCIALCVQTKLEELYASGIVDRSANHRPRLFIVAANDRPDEDVQGLRTALDMLRVAYPDFHIELSERTPEQAMRAALAEELRDALDACKINASQENFQRLTATMVAAPLFFPAQRPEGETAPADGQQHLQFGKVRTDDGRTFFCAFTDRARLLQWRNMGSVELGVKDYAPLVLSSNDTGIIIDPGVGSGLALTREMLQTLKAQLELRKKRYRKAMLYLYRNRNSQSKLMFIFSAGNFSQMLRRIRYVREYARYQKVQGELVRRKQLQVDAKHAQVVRTRDQKNMLLAEGRTQQSKLESQHAERTKIVSGLQKKIKQVQQNINTDKRKYNALNSRIDALIQAQIAAEQKRREAARRREAEARKAREAEQRRREAEQRAAEQRAAAKAKAETKTAAKDNDDKRETKVAVAAPKPSAEDARILRQDAEDKALSRDFASNQGRLPMPITGGYVITSHYGVNNVEGLRGVQVDNKGINITGKPGAQARAIFDGEVSAVFSLGGYSNVLIRHGSYISAYCNLSSVSVSRGQKVHTRQTIGSVARDPSGNCTLHFQLRRETSALNPESWLAR